MNKQASQAFDKYLARVGYTPAARLAWLFRVLNEFRLHQGANWLPGDLDNLSRELAFFAGIGHALPGWGDVPFLDGEITPRPSIKEVQALLASCHQLVEEAEHRRPLPVPTFPVKQTLQWAPTLGRYLLLEHYDDRVTWDDRVRYALAFLLKEEAARIQRCPARLPHEGKRCAALFLKSKRQKYCSKTCTSREMTRAKRHRDEQTLTTRAKKGAKQHGPKKHR